MDTMDLTNQLADKIASTHCLVWAGILHDRLYWKDNEYTALYDEATTTAGIDPYDQWIVTEWLAFELLKRGEVVITFATMHIWQRKDIGSAVYKDSVIQEIANNS